MTLEDRYEDYLKTIFPEWDNLSHDWKKSLKKRHILIKRGIEWADKNPITHETN